MTATKRISDIIKVQDIRQWKQGDTIAIKAPTGSGKSYFIMNMLYPYAKYNKQKILFMVNRTSVYDQFKHIIESQGKTDFIDLMMYQSLELIALYAPSNNRMEINNPLDNYDYIVSDEFHYFMIDSPYNKTTDLSLHSILNKIDAVKIFMSATTDIIMAYMESIEVKLKVYALEQEVDRINRLYFTYNDQVIQKYLLELPKDEKVIYFSQSVKKAYNLHKLFKDSMFLCSKHNKEYRNKMNKKKIESLYSNEKFEERILFTTTALDNGVSICDTSIKHIIVDIKDFDIMMQAIGRKRMKDEKDKFTLIIKAMNGRIINTLRNSFTDKIKMAEDLEWGISSADFVKTYPRKNYGNLIYDVPEKNDLTRKVVNQVMLFKYKYDIDLFNKLLDFNKEEENSKKKKTKDQITGYIDHVLKLLKVGTFEMLEDIYEAAGLHDYLNNIVGKKLFKEEQNELIELMNVKVDGKQIKRYSTFNSVLEEMGLNFIIKSKQEKQRVLKNDNNPDYNKTYWMIFRITEE